MRKTQFIVFCKHFVDIKVYRESIPDVHILNVAIGNTSDIDHANSILMKCNNQIDRVCQMIQVRNLNAFLKYSHFKIFKVL